MPYDLALYVANWPEPTRDAWRTLLKARAIENQCFVVGVNRSGNDANGHRYAGDSLVADHAGETACGCGRRRRLEDSVRHAAALQREVAVFKRRIGLGCADQQDFPGPTLSPQIAVFVTTQIEVRRMSAVIQRRIFSQPW